MSDRDGMFVQEDFGQFGSILRLGDISEAANFTCEVFDRRARDGEAFKDGNFPKTRVTVEVHVAEELIDVCDNQVDSGMFWPVTLKVN